ncbi:hypothetical protein PINS_up003690 [Pythium insidiosum]|nr:hypothetical protein PINS_up003690 [Pythium insidiosum]
MGLGIREVRTTPLAPSSSAASTTASSHTSLGRLLRVLSDKRCELRHVKSAIELFNQRRHQQGAADPLLTLSDHRQIAGVGVVLDSLANAARSLSLASTSNTAAPTDTHRNLLEQFVSTAVVRSVEDATATNHNRCVWTTRSRKWLVLLRWLHGQHPLWSVWTNGLEASKADKAAQLATCLVLFEQLNGSPESSQDSLDDATLLTSPLTAIVKNGCTQAAQGLSKPTTLGLAALDTLIALTRHIAARMMQKPSLIAINSSTQAAFLRAVRLVIESLLQWHAGSERRRPMIVALKQLHSLADLTDVSNSDQEAYESMREMLCWHWIASSEWMCSRSDSVLRAKSQFVTSATSAIQSLGQEPSASLHVWSARLRRVGFLLAIGQRVGITDLSVDARARLVLALVLQLTSQDSDRTPDEVPGLTVFMQEMLSWCLTVRGSGIFISLAEESAFFKVATAQLVARSSVGATRGWYCLVEWLLQGNPTRLEVFVLHLISVSDNADVAMTLLGCMERVVISEARLTSALRQSLVESVVETVVHHPIHAVRARAVVLLPFLDLALVLKLMLRYLDHLDDHTAQDLLDLVFAAASDTVLEGLVSVVIETSRHLVHNEPKPLRDAQPSTIHQKPGEESVQENRLLSLSLTGWCRHLPQHFHATVLLILLRNLWDTPRDATVLLHWLRELARLDWCRHTFPVVIDTIAEHLVNLDRLDEKTLEDDSSKTTQAIETLLFARLAPHLTLRVMPQDLFLSFSDTVGLQNVVQELWRETVDPLEFKEIKMLAVELLAKSSMHKVHATVLAQLEVFLQEQLPSGATLARPQHSRTESLQVVTPCGFVIAKLMVYYLNRSFAVADTSIDDALVAQSCGLLLQLLSIPCVGDDASLTPQRSPLMDLQLGAIECLALLLVHELALDCSVRPVTDRVLKIITDEETDDTQLRVCCCNALLSMINKLDSRCLPIVGRYVIEDSLLPLLTTRLENPESMGVDIAGILQFFFSFFFKSAALFSANDSSAQRFIWRLLAIVEGILASNGVSPQVFHLWGMTSH